MIIPKLDFLLVNVREVSGISKTKGDRYSFFQGVFSDDEGSIFNFILDKALMANETMRLRLLSLKNTPVVVSVKFTPSGFAVKGTVVAIED